MLSGAVYCSIGMHASVHLSKLTSAMRSILKITLMYKQEATAKMQGPCTQCALNFCTPTADPSVLTGSAIVEEEYIQQAKDSNNKSYLPIFLLYKIIITSWFFDYRAGEKAVKELYKCSGDSFDVLSYTAVYLHQGLFSSSSARGGNRRRIRTTRKCLKELRTIASYCPANVMNNVRLLEAEIDVYERNIDDALIKYNEAWKLGHAEELWSECGLICECAARALDYFGRRSEADEMLHKAIEAYQEWGATVKVDILTQQLSR
jgi:hypothetical protein